MESVGISRSQGSRLVAAALACLLLAAGCAGSPGAVDPISPTSAPTPATTTAAEPDPTPTATAEATSDPDEEERLEELRAGRNFIELAEHDRAPGGRWSQFTYTQFGIAGDGELVGEWTNKRELWDSFVPAFRDECLLAGEPATEPMWDDELMIPVGVASRWNDEATEGRGHSVDVNCVFVGPDGEMVEKWFAALIAIGEQDSGEITAVMPSFDIPESEFEVSQERLLAVREHIWNWIVEQPVLATP